MDKLNHFAKSPIHCRIYQADFDQVMDLMFATPLPEGCRRNVPAEKYVLVFDGMVAAENLEDLYRIFNIAHPAGYTGRSLSVTDVIEVDDGQEREIYVCGNFGYDRANFDVTAIGSIQAASK